MQVTYSLRVFIAFAWQLHTSPVLYFGIRPGSEAKSYSESGQGLNKSMGCVCLYMKVNESKVLYSPVLIQTEIFQTSFRLKASFSTRDVQAAAVGYEITFT